MRIPGVNHRFKSGPLSPADADALTRLAAALGQLSFSAAAPLECVQDGAGVNYRLGKVAGGTGTTIEVESSLGSPDYTDVSTLIFEGATADTLTQPAAGQAELHVFGASGTHHGTGLVPDPGSTAGITRFLREDATWQTPSTTPSTFAPNIGCVFPATPVPSGQETSPVLITVWQDGLFVGGNRIQIPADPKYDGKYMVGASAFFDVALGYRRIRVRHNANKTAEQSSVTPNTGPFLSVCLSVSGLFNVRHGDYFDFLAFQTGSNLNVNSDGDAAFWAVRVAD